MVFIPGTEIYKQLGGASSGLCLERDEISGQVFIAVKLYSNIIKSIYDGALCSLVISVVEDSDINYRFLGLKVEFSPPEIPLSISHPSIRANEYEFIAELLGYAEARIHFLDEFMMPVLSGNAQLNVKKATETKRGLQTTIPHFSGEYIKYIEFVHDKYISDQESIYFGGILKHTLFNSYVSMDINFEAPPKIMRIVEGGFIHSYQITDINEGDILESSSFACIQSVFSKNTFRSPFKEDRKELADVIGFNSDMICLIQAKILPVLRSNPNRSKEKRWKTSVEKNAFDALRQAQGSVKSIRNANLKLFSEPNLDSVIELPNRSSITIHALVVVSEMHGMVSWDKVAEEMIRNAQKETNVFYHVLDLLELQQIVNASRVSQLLHKNLLIRWETLKINRTTFIRANRFIPNNE